MGIQAKLEPLSHILRTNVPPPPPLTTTVLNFYAYMQGAPGNDLKFVRRSRETTHLSACGSVPSNLLSNVSQQLGKKITDKDVIDMVGLGLSDGIIITKIRAAAAGGTLQFDISVDGLKEFKAGKVSDEVIKVMINPTPPAAPIVVAATPISNDPGLPPQEVGVYWKNSNAFVLIEGQAISQAKAALFTQSPAQLRPYPLSAAQPHRERTFAHRRLATRFDKLKQNFHATVAIACCSR